MPHLNEKGQIDPAQSIVAKTMRMAALSSLADNIKARHNLKTLNLYPTSQGHMELSDIEVPKENRKQGVGSAVMNELTNYADSQRLKMVLHTAMHDPRHGTTSRSRLKKFYKRFDFVENKGRNIDYSISHSMYRDPVIGESE